MGAMDIRDAVAGLERDLRAIFGSRLQSLAVYGPHARGTKDGAPHTTETSHHHAPPVTHTLAVVEALSGDDLRACTPRVAAWHDAGLATPLLLAAHEFERSLDAFPFEFGAILANHRVVAGANPFAGMAVDPSDLRRACEVQARSHLLHLREGYLETLGRGDRLAVLIVASAPAFAALVGHLARLDGAAGDVAGAARHLEQRLALPSSTASDIIALVGVSEISSADAARLIAPYLDVVERLVQYVDAWQ
jgi:hypothetical protein